MTFDTEMRDLAAELAEDLGKAVTYIRVTGEEFDPEAGETVKTTEEHDVSAVPPQSVSTRLIDGSNVKVGDMVVGVPATSLEFTPSTDDRLRIDGDDWSIVRIEPIYSGEKVAVYNLQVRR